jgi:hypothetical protein
MKSSSLFFLMVVIGYLTLLTTACSGVTTQVSFVTSTRSETFISGSGQELPVDGLGLTEEQVQILKEKGIVDVDSVKVASLIAGFDVATPDCVPEGFSAGKFIVQLSGAGLPEALKPKFNNTRVDQYFTRPGEKFPMFVVTQSPHQFGISGSEPIMICGRTFERIVSRVTLSDAAVHDRLELSWDAGGVSYIIVAVLGEELNEASTANVACSLSAD